MKFNKKYVNTIENALGLPENKDKIVISDNAYAICEMIDKLLVKLDKLRWQE